jgi:hypothetical protein
MLLSIAVFFFLTIRCFHSGIFSGDLILGTMLVSSKVDVKYQSKGKDMFLYYAISAPLFLYGNQLSAFSSRRRIQPFWGVHLVFVQSPMSLQRVSELGMGPYWFVLFQLGGLYFRR